MPDYVSLFLDSPAASLGVDAFISLLFLSLARLLPIILQSPFFGARVMPNPVKVVFAISLYIIFLPKMLQVISGPIPFNSYVILLAIKEFFVGLSMGFIMSAPFIIVQNVGMIIDHQRGGASLLINDPTIQNQSSPLGTLFNMVLIYVFYLVDGPFYFMNAMIEAYELMPPDQVFSPLFFQKDNPFWVIMFRAFNTVMVISAQLGAPALIAILMTDMFLGIANRLAPQVQITFLGLPLKSLLALTVICVGWKLYNQQTVVEIFKWLDILQQAIGGLSPPTISS
ncbi:MAG: EscT/YscT/HrcT family type III secretion system export apparatus protein [Chlamydiales bacterium]